MKRLMILLVVLLPILVLGQTTAWSYVKGPSVKSTGRYRTIKQPFTTIYSPKMCNGRIMQMEAYCNNGTDSAFTYWIDITYYKKRLIGRKKYELWEIYRAKP